MLSPQLQITLPYVLLGLCFAAGAVYLQATRTFALSALKTDEPALKIGYDKFSLQTVYPVIALYVIAAFCAVGIPGYKIFLDAQDDLPITVTAHVEPSNVPLNVALPDGGGNTNALIRLPVCRCDGQKQQFLLENPQYQPSTLVLWFDKDTGAVMVQELTDLNAPQRIRLNGHQAEVQDPIVLQPAAKTPVTAVHNVLTAAARLAPGSSALLPPENLGESLR